MSALPDFTSEEIRLVEHCGEKVKTSQADIEICLDADDRETTGV